jgi:hypothetical protein
MILNPDTLSFNKTKNFTSQDERLLNQYRLKYNTEIFNKEFQRERKKRENEYILEVTLYQFLLINLRYSFFIICLNLFLLLNRAPMNIYLKSRISALLL